MPITVPDQAPIRVSYVVGPMPTTDFVWPKRLFTDEDIKCYVNGNPTPVTFTVITPLPVEGFPVNSGPTIRLDLAIDNSTLVIVGDKPVERSTNYPSPGPFPIDTLNRQMNEIFAILQEFETRLERVPQAAPWSLADFSQLVLPDPEDGFIPSWNGTQGDMVNVDPAGFQGAPGPAGLNWLGTWNIGTNYVANDGVFYNGSSYIALQANVGSQPDTNPADWDLLAQEGAAGAGSGDMQAVTYFPFPAQVLLGNSQAQTVQNKTFDNTNDFSGTDLAETDVVNAFTRTQYFGLTTLIDGVNVNWDLDLNQVAQVIIAGNRTLAAPTNQKAGATYILIVRQDPTGGRTLAFDATYKFKDGSPPIVAAGSNAVSILTFISDGTDMYGVSQENFS